jgi:tetratricopeptide (TPR) repeat protein
MTQKFESQRIVKRLAAAEGYLELGMPSYALTELNVVKEAGPFEAISQLLRGEALQAEERFSEAIPAFNRAAELVPEPFNQRALLGLSRCYRAEGQEDLANEAEQAAMPKDLPEGTKSVQIVITPIFTIDAPEEDRFSEQREERDPPPKG